MEVIIIDYAEYVSQCQRREVPTDRILTEDEFDSILAMKKGQGILISNQDNVMINVMASEKEDRLITTDASKLREYYGDSKQIEREQQRRIAG